MSPAPAAVQHAPVSELKARATPLGTWRNSHPWVLTTSRRSPRRPVCSASNSTKRAGADTPSPSSPATPAAEASPSNPSTLGPGFTTGGRREVEMLHADNLVDRPVSMLHHHVPMTRTFTAARTLRGKSSLSERAYACLPDQLLNH